MIPYTLLYEERYIHTLQGSTLIGIELGTTCLQSLLKTVVLWHLSLKT